VFQHLSGHLFVPTEESARGPNPARSLHVAVNSRAEGFFFFIAEAYRQRVVPMARVLVLLTKSRKFWAPAPGALIKTGI
jgi:hypothetical protein